MSILFTILGFSAFGPVILPPSPYADELKTPTSEVISTAEPSLENSQPQKKAVSKSAVSQSQQSATVLERNLEAYWATLSDDQIRQDVLALQSANKYNAAQDRLDFLVHRNPHPENRFLWAKNNELLEHYQVAFLEYESLLSRSDLDDGWISLLRYRRGIVLDDMGRHLDAVADFKRALKAKGLSSEDREKINLLMGSALINGGRSWCGVWTINRALASFKSSNAASWARARARTALLSELIASAESRPIRPGNKISEDIAYRQKWLSQAEAQAKGIIQLEEPEYVQRSFVLLIDAYMRFYDEVVHAPPPEEFDAFQSVIYRQKMREQADPLRYRAKRMAKKALNYANSTAWQGMNRNAIYKRRIAIDKEESLP